MQNKLPPISNVLLSCPTCQMQLCHSASKIKEFCDVQRVRVNSIIEQLLLELHLPLDTPPYSLTNEIRLLIVDKVRELTATFPYQLEEAQRLALRQNTYDELFRFGRLGTITFWPSVSHIYVRSWEQVYVEHCGRMDKIEHGTFESPSHLRRLVNNLAYPEALTSDSPFVSRNLSELQVPYECSNRYVFKGWMHAFLTQVGTPCLMLTPNKPPGGDDRLPTPLPSGTPATKGDSAH